VAVKTAKTKSFKGLDEINNLIKSIEEIDWHDFPEYN
jgi:hypothetical protein